MKDVERVVEKLKEIIDINGQSYLIDEPYKVYKELIKSGTDRKIAAAVLYVLTVGTIEHVDFTQSAELVSGTIQKECNLNKSMSDNLAMILCNLYSDENKKAWSDKNLEGLVQFLDEEFVCKWEGFEIWDAGNCTVDCHYKAEIHLSPTEKISEDKELSGMLKKNPFTAKESIHAVFSGRLQDCLDSSFREYCQADDYYEPVVEDFCGTLENDVNAWCKENGFEFMSWDGYGTDDGYEPKHTGRWH